MSIPRQSSNHYQELKSPKPRLGFFFAAVAAMLVDGSSSATRFLEKEVVA